MTNAQIETLILEFTEELNSKNLGMPIKFDYRSRQDIKEQAKYIRKQNKHREEDPESIASSFYLYCEERKECFWIKAKINWSLKQIIQAIIMSERYMTIQQIKTYLNK
jgi:hypothetical protein